MNVEAFFLFFSLFYAAFSQFVYSSVCSCSDLLMNYSLWTIKQLTSLSETINNFVIAPSVNFVHIVHIEHSWCVVFTGIPRIYILPVEARAAAEIKSFHFFLSSKSISGSDFHLRIFSTSGPVIQFSTLPVQLSGHSVPVYLPFRFYQWGIY